MTDTNFTTDRPGDLFNVYEYLEHAIRDCGIVEIRHHIRGRWESGLFNDLPYLLKAVDQRLEQGALYSTLNAPSDRHVGNSFGATPLKNDDMVFIKRIPFDFDPIRPAGVSSSDAELEAAIECRNEVVSAMKALGWPMPAMALSGNGAHAVWRCSVRSEERLAKSLHVIYSQIKAQFAELFEYRQVHFDTCVRNPGRILRLYGTVNRKGEHTVERPHRLASVRIPTTWQNVTAQQVKRLADNWAPAHQRETQQARSSVRIDGQGDYNTLNVVEWFRAKGMYEKPAGFQVHSVKCPWEGEHSTHGDHADTVVFENPGSWPGFFCHHSHCNGRNIRDVMNAFGDADAYCASVWGGRHG
jgi:hypothetical protein